MAKEKNNEVNETPKSIGFVPQVLKKLTKAVISIKNEGQVAYIKILSPMFKGKEMQAAEGQTRQEPAMLVECINLETSEESQLIVNAVVEGVLRDNYPDDSYVGHGFAITCLGKKDGKRYKLYDVVEIAV